VPFNHLLPPLLDKLCELGLQKDDIRFFIATGTHTPATKAEIVNNFPESIVDNYCILTHDCDDANNLKYLGETKLGTPIYINQEYYQSHLKIVVGNIEPHHFMGYSGGVKSASIGLTGRETINRNHSLLLTGNSNMGEYETNPMRMDVEEIGKIIGVQFALNTVLNSDKHIVEVYSGDPVAVMQAGIPVSKKVCAVDVCKMFDIVIASVGGYPKDINLYQSQKALSNACLITKIGGTVILLAECIDGIGSESFSEFINGKTDPQSVLSYFNRENFSVGPHKAYQFARQLQHVQVIIVSCLKDEVVRQCWLTPAKDLQTAFLLAIQGKNKNISIGILPYATNTIPNFTLP
jgi:nickel-dependent lactate racemase